MLPSAVLAATAALLVSSTNAQALSTRDWPVYINYTTVTGYFLQDEASTNATTFNYVRVVLSSSVGEID